MNRFGRSFTIPLLTLVIFGCSTPVSDGQDVTYPGLAIPFEQARSSPQPLIEMRISSFPNTNVDTNSWRVYVQPFDQDSIEQFITVQKDTVYHPVAMCHRALQFIGAFLKNGDSLTLKRAEKYALKLRTLSQLYDGALFVPYHFDHKLHVRSDLLLKAPFFSGMAQGEMLSVMTRLHYLTGKPEYLEWAKQSFASLFRIQQIDNPWVSRVDSNGYFWIEEYLIPDGMDQTLNGYIAALYGVYDFAVLVKDPQAKALWDACLTTLKHYLNAYRRPNMTSYYCLGHHFPATEDYHRLHISMCRELTRMSGDEFFLEVARGMNQDKELVSPF